MLRCGSPYPKQLIIFQWWVLDHKDKQSANAVGNRYEMVHKRLLRKICQSIREKQVKPVLLFPRPPPPPVRTCKGQSLLRRERFGHILYNSWEKGSKKENFQVVIRMRDYCVACMLAAGYNQVSAA